MAQAGFGAHGHKGAEAEEAQEATPGSWRHSGAASGGFSTRPAAGPAPSPRRAQSRRLEEGPAPAPAPAPAPEEIAPEPEEIAPGGKRRRRHSAARWRAEGASNF